MVVKDPNVLLSYINTKLRDECNSLDEFCNVYDYSKDQVIEQLQSIGYHYDKSLNQFR